MAKKKTPPTKKAAAASKKTAANQAGTTPQPAAKDASRKAETKVTEVASTEVTAPAAEDQPRKLKLPEYKSFKLQKRILSPKAKLPSGLSIFKQALTLLWQYRKPMLGVLAIYALMNIVLVQIFSGLDLNTTKAAFQSAYAGHWGQLWSGLSLFGYLLGSSVNSQAAGAYQFVVVLLGSLVFIWALRQAFEGAELRVRDAYYRSMQPLIPFILVLVVMLLQSAPLLIGSFLYGFVGSDGPVGAPTLVLCLAVLFLLLVLALYLISSSIFALYIVCLPGVEPMQAVKMARQLVQYRRWLVMRRILVLPLILLIIGAVIMVPIALFLTPIAVWVFFVLTIVTLPVIHAYMYKLYRQLL